MIKPPVPERERERLEELESYRILDTLPEQAYEDLAKITTAICGTPMAVITLIDGDRQWFKSSVGLDMTQGETSRDVAFCAHAINEPERMLIVRDAREDLRFSDNPFVTGDPNVRFYAGAPLVTPKGNALGTLCVLDRVPRTLEPAQIEALRSLSRQVVALMELRKAYHALRHHLDERGWYERQLKQYQSDLEAENVQLTRQSGTDALTGLANRRAMNATMEWRIERAREGEPLHLAIVDIDHFKTINDLHGHQAGDETLAAVAAVLRDQHGTDAARAGGEEFVLLLPLIDTDAALRECENAREAVQFMPSGIPVTVSIGVARYRDGDTAADVYLRADRALYEAKRGGRNRVTLAAD